jgi:hypothetical protein
MPDKYESLHAQALIQLLEQPKSCRRCVLSFYDTSKEWPESTCDYCHNFVCPPGKSAICGTTCPCNVWGPQEAAKRSWLKLEELGYI